MKTKIKTALETSNVRLEKIGNDLDALMCPEFYERTNIELCRDIELLSLEVASTCERIKELIDEFNLH